MNSHGVLAEAEEIYEEALSSYERAVKLGVKRAEQNLRNVDLASSSGSLAC